MHLSASSFAREPQGASEPDDIPDTLPVAPLLTTAARQTDKTDQYRPIQTNTDQNSSLTVLVNRGHQDTASRPDLFTSPSEKAPRPGCGSRPTSHHHPRSLPAPFVSKGARRSDRALPRQHYPYHPAHAIQYPIHACARHHHHRHPRVAADRRPTARPTSQPEPNSLTTWFHHQAMCPSRLRPRSKT